jgi:phosphatidylinositol alpha 1,6-mannosyltransferase
VLLGQALAEAYANMDIFLFPSRTDTFGNVVQEALASGVPAIVTNSGGPRFIVRHGISGYIAEDDEGFCRLALTLARDAEMRRTLSAHARRQMKGRSWDSVFTEVYNNYARFLQPM